MNKYLVVEIEHNRYARFLPLDSKDKGELNLTTLVDNQKKAEVKIYIVYKGKKQLFHTFSVFPIPRQRAGEPRLLLSGTFDGVYGVHLTLKVNGKLWASKDLSVRKYIRSRKSLLPVFLVLLLLVLGLGILQLSRSCDPAVDREHSSADASTSRQTDDKSSEDREEAEEAPDKEDIAAEDSPRRDTTEDDTTEGDTTEGDTIERDKPAEEESRQEEKPADLPEDTTIFFEPNRSGITSTAAEKLSRLAEELAEYPEAELKITGHCALYGTEQGRIELSQQRAKAVENFLYRQGWSPETPPEVTGVGGKDPLTRDRDRQHVNRRVEITIN
ncbi:MAG: OmpA family protein [Spirochaetaceae bacterium]